MTPETPEHLFVYGTLRRDKLSPMAQLLAHGGDWVGEATVQGRLYQVDYYPGMVPSADPQDKVHGEVYRLGGPAKVLAALDAYEGCDPDCAPPTEFQRRKTRVQLEDGQLIEAWVYIYNRSSEGLPRIESGDF